MIAHGPLLGGAVIQPFVFGFSPKDCGRATVKPIQCTSIPTPEGASAMSDTPPPPPGMPPIPPPPPPPGFGLDDKEEEAGLAIEDEADEGSDMEKISQLIDELPSLDYSESPPPPPPGLDTPPPPPPGFEANEEEDEESWDVDELDIQSFDDSLASLEEMEEEDPDDESQEISDLSSEDWNTALDRAITEEDDSKPESEDVDEPQLALSSNLRPSSEVDSIPGDKLYVTLKEKEESVLNPDGTVRQQSIDGELILRNSSRKDRAWDIEVLLQNTASTDI